MDFGDILNKWDGDRDGDGQRKQNRKKKEKKRDNQFADLIERYLPDKDAKTQKDDNEFLHIRDRQASRRKELREMAPQAMLDLHGFRAQEALENLELFLKKSRAQALVKVLIIHGKGIHSTSESVLSRTVQNHLERSSFAGEFGFAGKKMGGRGATWVILRA